MSASDVTPRSELDVPRQFVPGIRAVMALAAEARYAGALVFGSVADGTASEGSDLDVRVIVRNDNPCKNISHPRIGGVKLDVTFQSLRQLEEQTEEELRDGKRAPMLAGGAILFDKTGGLRALKARADAVQAPAYDPAAAQFDRFMLYHANDKVERALLSDPESSLYSMHATIGSVVEIHYRVNGHHKVSSKKLPADLDGWDPEFASLLRRFVAVANPDEKFELWTQIVDRTAASLGGRQPVEENICGCPVCVVDLASLQAAAAL